MNRRSLFITLLAPLVAFALPKKPKHHLVMYCSETNSYKHYIGDEEEAVRQYHADPPNPETRRLRINKAVLNAAFENDSRMWKEILEEGKRDMNYLQGDRWA